MLSHLPKGSLTAFPVQQCRPVLQPGCSRKALKSVVLTPQQLQYFILRGAGPPERAAGPPQGQDPTGPLSAHSEVSVLPSKGRFLTPRGRQEHQGGKYRPPRCSLHPGRPAGQEAEGRLGCASGTAWHGQASGLIPTTVTACCPSSPFCQGPASEKTFRGQPQALLPAGSTRPWQDTGACPQHHPAEPLSPAQHGAGQQWHGLGTAETFLGMLGTLSCPVPSPPSQVCQSCVRIHLPPASSQACWPPSGACLAAVRPSCTRQPWGEAESVLHGRSEKQAGIILFHARFTQVNRGAAQSVRGRRVLTALQAAFLQVVPALTCTATSPARTAQLGSGTRTACPQPSHSPRSGLARPSAADSQLPVQPPSGTLALGDRLSFSSACSRDLDTLIGSSCRGSSELENNSNKG